MSFLRTRAQEDTQSQDVSTRASSILTKIIRERPNAISLINYLQKDDDLKPILVEIIKQAEEHSKTTSQHISFSEYAVKQMTDVYYAENAYTTNTFCPPHDRHPRDVRDICAEVINQAKVLLNLSNNRNSLSK